MIEPTIDAIELPMPTPVAPETPVTDAAELLRQPETPAVVVCDDDRIVGLVTDSDIVAMVAETADRPPVRDVMSTPVTTIESTATVTEAADTMRAAGVKQVPVTDLDGYCGVLSVEHVAPYCSRSRLDIEWDAEPLALESVDVRKRSASD